LYHQYFGDNVWVYSEVLKQVMQDRSLYILHLFYIKNYVTN